MRDRRSIVFCLSSAGLAASLTLTGCSSTQQTRAPSRPSGGAFAVVDGSHVAPPAIEMGDKKTIRRIIAEGRNDNHAIDHLTELCNTFGPRLTGSTAVEQAGEWARNKFASWGLNRSRLDWWGDITVRFDRGPSTGIAYMRSEKENDDGTTEVEWENVRDLEFTTLAWTRGTDGPVRGQVLQMPRTEDELARVENQIPGAWLLIAPDYTGRAGVRQSGFLMRQRLQQRDELRKGVQPEESDQPQLASADATPVAIPEDPSVQHWTGTFDYHGSPVPVTLELHFADSGEVTGTESIPDFFEGPIHDASFDKDTGVLHYLWKHSMGVSDVTLTREGDAMNGASANASGVEFAVNLTRGVAQPEPAAASEPESLADTSSVLARVLELNPAGFISTSTDERVWTTSANGWREREIADYPTDVEVNVRQSDYDFLNSRVADDAPIYVEFDLANKLTEGPIPCYNVIAEITGTEKPDECVIVSAHLDSWNGPGSQGTVDNGTGTSVVLEAARILASVHAQPKRTIRFILWTGEEQGLLGSRAYVANLPKDELDRISAVFVDDGGTNYEGGMPAADVMVNYLAAATAPSNGAFYSSIDHDAALADEDPANDKDAGWMLVNIRPTGADIQTHSGSDHAAFNAVGVPGFFWDEVGRADYRHAWHTQNDRLDQAIPEYLAQSSTNMALVAYNLACAPDLLPRPHKEASESEDATPASGG
ncbi:MAG: M20/M25/M40 family metallo-hydrolase [Phycisphaerales bacterium]